MQFIAVCWVGPIKRPLKYAYLRTVTAAVMFTVHIKEHKVPLPGMPVLAVFTVWVPWLPLGRASGGRRQPALL
jgi:hypothetical protein